MSDMAQQFAKIFLLSCRNSQHFPKKKNLEKKSSYCNLKKLNAIDH